MLIRPLRRAAACAPGRALSTVPHAFPGHAYSPEKKAMGSADYEQLRTNWAELVPYRHATLACNYSGTPPPQLDIPRAGSERLLVVAAPSDLAELQQVRTRTPHHSLI